MQFETIDSIPLGPGHVALQKEILPPGTARSYDGPIPRRRVIYEMAGVAMPLANLDALLAVARTHKIDFGRALAGHEALFADILVPLLDEIGAIISLRSRYAYRSGWLLEALYGIDLDQYLPRVEGTTLRCLGRREGFVLLEPVEIVMDLDTGKWSAHDMTSWQEMQQRGPVIRLPHGDIVRIQDKPRPGQTLAFPYSTVVYVADGKERPVEDLDDLWAVTGLQRDAARRVIREHPLAFAHIACSLYDVRLLTPGWRHHWMASYVDISLANTWLQCDGEALSVLAYPVTDPQSDTYPLQPTLVRLSFNLSTLEHYSYRVETIHDAKN